MDDKHDGPSKGMDQEPIQSEDDARAHIISLFDELTQRANQAKGIQVEPLSPEGVSSLNEVIDLKAIQEARAKDAEFQKTGNPFSDAIGEYFSNHFASQKTSGPVHLDISSEEFIQEHGRPLLGLFLNAAAESLLKKQEEVKEQGAEKEEREKKEQDESGGDGAIIGGSGEEGKAPVKAEAETPEEAKVQAKAAKGKGVSVQVDLGSFFQHLFKKKKP